MNAALSMLMNTLRDTAREGFVAIERMDTPAQNRAVDRMNATVESILKFGSEGRQALEDWLLLDDRQLQSIAASYVFRWNPEIAVERLIDLAKWALGPKMNVPGQASIGIDAEILLADYFGIPFQEVETSVLGLPRDDRRDVG